ncbi:MAG: sensor histidine kinase [Rhodocyclaceae bacterium]|nr:sensor histidine kinase [Rhodocyclaceae bacterium]
MPTPELRGAPRGGLASLRLRLMLVILLCLAVGVPASAVLDYRDAVRLANEGYDHAIADLADVLADALVPVAGDAARVAATARDIGMRVAHSDADDSVRFAVIDGDGQLLAGAEGLEAYAAPPRVAVPVFADARIDGQPWRLVTLSVRDAPGLRVVVAETMGKRNQIASDILGNVVYVNILVFLLLSLVLSLATGWVMDPLMRLGRAVDARKPDDLRPLSLRGLPSEAGGLVEAINRLLGRLEKVHADEQAFLSAAAHQLRTPLATLRTRLELAARGADPDTARRLGEVIDSSRELTHTTHQMLALARARDAVEGGPQAAAVDVSALLTSVADQCLDRALARGIDLGFDIGCERIRGVRWLLREALLNLVENALLHAVGATRVTIACHADHAEALLLVEDDGCGVDEKDRSSLFERFRRGDTPVPGSGLGLAIVRAAAEAHGGRVDFEPAPMGGACFVIHLPA